MGVPESFLPSSDLFLAFSLSFPNLTGIIKTAFRFTQDVFALLVLRRQHSTT